MYINYVTLLKIFFVLKPNWNLLGSYRSHNGRVVFGCWEIVGFVRVDLLKEFSKL